MGYNKAREERKWLQWKAAEEKKMRELGVGEDIIASLHTFDWEIFKADRRFYERQETLDGAAERSSEPEDPWPRSPEALLDEISDPALWRFLKMTDRKTLEILWMKMEGFTSTEISRFLGLSEQAINFRMHYLKKKAKKLKGSNN